MLLLITVSLFFLGKFYFSLEWCIDIESHDMKNLLEQIDGRNAKKERKQQHLLVEKNKIPSSPFDENISTSIGNICNENFYIEYIFELIKNICIEIGISILVSAFIR